MKFIKIKKCLFLFITILVSINLYSQNIGIGTNTPVGELHVTLPFTFSGITFTGTGSNDLSVNYNTFNGSGTKYFIVEITNAGPNPNILKWSNDGGSTWTENVQASTSPIAIGFGVNFQFNNTSGHLFGDRWSWSVVQSYPNGLVVKYGNTALGHTNPTRRLDINGGAVMDSIKINNGASNNRVLTSDISGNAKWKNPILLFDSDNDTKIDVEKNTDDDSIRFITKGIENWIIADHKIIPKNSGNSIFIGENAGDADNFTDNKNLGIGYRILRNTTTGYNNIALGNNALESNVSGYQNVAQGDSTLYSNTVGHWNIAFGYRALRRNTIGLGNIAFGVNSLMSNQTGDYNISLGFGCLGASYDVGNHNIAIGHQVLENEEGDHAIGIGYRALQKNNSTIGCIGIGFQACKENTDGWYTTGIGYNALKNNTTGQQNIAVGGGALATNTTGRDNVAVGSYALSFGNDNNYNVAIGSNALTSNSTGDNNTAVGYYSSGINSSGYNNTSIGYKSSYANYSGHDNSSIGNLAMESTSSGHYNTGIGSSALNNNTSGYSNTAVGMQAVFNNITSDGNTGVGLQALYASTGGFNTAMGYAASGTGSYTHAIGVGATVSNTASYQARIGNSSITSIGGYAGWSNLSDVRFKTNIKENVPGLALINKLRPITYTLDVYALNDFLNVPDSIQNIPSFRNGYDEKSKIIQTGFIAQEVEAAANALGFEFSGIDLPKNENDHYSLRYAEFVVPLVKAVQELSKENEALKNKLASYESRLAEIESMLLSKSKF